MTKEELIRMCKKGKRTLTKYKVPDGEQKIQLFINDLLEVLQSEPEIVRCKDCKKLGYTNSHWFCKWLNRCVDEDWFCADGEREEDT